MSVDIPRADSTWMLRAARGEVRTDEAFAYVRTARSDPAGLARWPELDEALSDGDQRYPDDDRWDDAPPWGADVDVDPATTEAFDACTPSRPCGHCDWCEAEPGGHVGNYADDLLFGMGICSLPPPEYLVDGYLVRDSLAMMYAPSGAGKSFMALSWAMHVATGRPWMGRQVQQGGVHYVVAEGASGMGKRLAAWAKWSGADSPGTVEFKPRAVNLADLGEVSALCAHVAETRPALVVFDTLARCSVGADENSARDMGLFLENMDRVRRASGACVLVLHHTGKDVSAGGRGSSALRAAMDTELELVGDVQSTVTLRVTKQKDGPEANPLRFVAEPVGGSLVLVPADPNAPADMSGKVLLTIAALRGVHVPEGVSASVWEEAAKDKGVGRTMFYEHRSDLVARGTVRNLAGPFRPKYVLNEPDHASDEEAQP